MGSRVALKFSICGFWELSHLIRDLSLAGKKINAPTKLNDFFYLSSTWFSDLWSTTKNLFAADNSLGK